METTYQLHGHQLEQVKNAKYLGVELSNNLSWTDHIKATSKKANRTSAFVYRNLKGCSTKIQNHCYKTLVRPIMEYASPIWDPSESTHSDLLESVQRRSARRILHDFDPRSSVTSMLQKLELPTLKERRKIDKVAMMYRIQDNQININTDHVLKRPPRATRGQANKYFVPQSRSNTHLHSFFPSGIRLWNSLPSHAYSAQTLPCFKATLGEWAKSQ